MDEKKILKIAQRQVGIVTAAQCHREGVSRDVTMALVKRGMWQRVHRGIYKCGATRLTLEEKEMAAMLAVGEPAALSHLSAAYRFRLPTEVPQQVDVTVPHGRQVGLLVGVNVHHTRQFPANELINLGAFKCTTLAQTVVDLAPSLDETKLRVVIDACLRRRDAGFLDELRKLGEGRDGMTKLRTVIATYQRFRKPGVSVLESLASDLLFNVNGRPLQNHWVWENGKVIGEVDFAWPEVKLAVEVDGKEFHTDAESFERDREKTNQLQKHGWVVYRFTYKQITEQRDECIRLVQQAYARLAKKLSAGRPDPRAA